LLDPLLGRVDRDVKSRPIEKPVLIFLGDYVDRGPDSAGVVQRLLEREKMGNTICLKGNHELYFLEFLANPQIFTDWSKYGALPTLLSYGIRHNGAFSPAAQIELADELMRLVPYEHLTFLQNLPESFACGDYFFVHAGVRPGRPLGAQLEDDLLWIREDFLLHEEPFDKFIVHGHTPVREPEIKPNRINIDTGAYATGRLTCLVLEGDDQKFL
jgi:serine/threonine protein phosphatase 1